MGLAGAKNKRKLGKDPNNTKWSRNTETFGQRFLRSQGWEPGQYLGAQDAPHAEWHTEANAAHIRVVLKEDNLGLGAKRNQGDECTGLDAFQSLLGRLNGKSEEVLMTEKKARDDVRTSLYVEQRFGSIRFVKGGWLVGDQVKDAPNEKNSEPSENTADVPMLETDGETQSDANPKRSKKRKAEQEEKDGEKGDVKKEKKAKKRKTRDESTIPMTVAEEDAEGKGKKSKKRRKATTEDETEVTDLSASISNSPQESGSVSNTEPVDNMSEQESTDEATSKSRKEKMEKKEKKEKKKHKSKKSSHKASDVEDESQQKKKRKKDKNRDKGEDSSKPTEIAPDSISSTPAATTLSTPVTSGYSTPTFAGPIRNLSRKRFIAQKRMAFSDPTALNQIFMIKSAAAS